MARTPRSTAKRPGPYIARPPTYTAPTTYTPPPHQPLPSIKPPTPRKPTRIPGFFLYGTAAFATVIIGYTTSLYITSTRLPSHPTSASLSSQTDVTAVYDTTASSFDSDVGLSEWLGGVMRARKKLAQQCKGHVLEVSCGTGRNLGYYRFGGGEQGARSLTLVDLSEAMVGEARRKWEILGGEKKSALTGTVVRFLRGDCEGEMPGPPVVVRSGDGEGEVEGKEKEKGVVDEKEKAQVKVVRTAGRMGYDTIIQTMGLCSCPSPVQLLKNLVGHLNTENEDSRILLMEHGRSYYEWLNRILDNHAPHHAEKHGCWWNRDIGGIVEESGLEIVKEQRKHFGTLWIFELKPKKDGVSVGEKAKGAIKETTEEIRKDGTKKLTEGQPSLDTAKSLVERMYSATGLDSAIAYIWRA